MSDFDPKDIHSDITSQSDFDPADIHQSTTPGLGDQGLINTLVTKAGEGATLGFDDELAGAISALGRAGGIENLGGKIKDVHLSDEGPTLDPEALLKAYRETRDKTRAVKAQMSADRPLTSLAANLAGGLATGKVLPTAPFGEVAQDASLATKMVKGAQNAAPLGAIAGLGSSNADLTQGDVSGALNDTTTGAELGAGLGAAIPLAGAGINAVGNKLSSQSNKLKEILGRLVPDKLKAAYQAGQEGVDISSPEFYKNTNAAQNQITDEVANPILNKIEQQQAEHQSKMADVQGKLRTSEYLNSQAQAKAQADQLAQQNSIEEQIAQINSDTKKALDIGKARQQSINADDINQANKDIVKVAENLQKRVYDVKQDLGKQFDQLDKAAEATNVSPENRDVISSIVDKIKTNSGLPETQINAIENKLQPLLGKNDIQSYRNLKSVLSDYFDNANPVVRSTMKQGYTALKNNYSNDLRNAGYGQLADQMAETNGRWAAMNQLEDNFLSNIRGPDRVTGQFQAHPDTINAVSQFGEKNPAQMAKADYLTNLLNKFGGKGIQGQEGQLPNNPIGQSINEMGAATENLANAKAAGANINPGGTGTTSDVINAMQNPGGIPQLPNPKLTQLQQMLAQVKGQNPQASALPELPNSGTAQLQEQLSQLKGQNPTDIATAPNLNTSTPEALKNDLLNTLPKYGMKTGNIQAENKLDQAFNTLRQLKGDDYVNNLQQRMQKVNRDIMLRSPSETGEEVPGGLTAKVAGKLVGGASKAVNALGRASTKADKFLKIGATNLTEASPEDLQTLADQMKSQGKVGQSYAGALESAKSKNDIGKAAIINGLMQQPAFRALFHGIVGTQEESGDESK